MGNTILRQHSSIAKEVPRKQFIDDVYRYYFVEGLSQVQTARKLGVSPTTIRRVFNSENWSVRTKQFTDEDVRRLYYDEHLSQSEVATRLGTSKRSINRIFRKHGWEARSHGATGIDGEIHRLYFEEGLSQKEIADRFGFKSVKPIRRIFRENDWTPRRRVFNNDEERKLARKENRKATYLRMKELRETLFGKECQICGINNDERNLAIHRKDGVKHKENILRRIRYLESLNPDDYAALCTECHRGVHWLMENHGVQWDKISSFISDKRHVKPKKLEPLNLPDKEVPSSKRYLELKNSEEELEHLGRALFGENCYFCGVHYSEKRIVTHRKDGRPHNRKMLESEIYLRTLNPNEWVSLCNKCHRYVHWARDKLHMEWEDLDKAFHDNS